MTAVAPPPNFQPISRTSWNGSNGTPSGLNAMSANEVSRIFIPRKGAQRTNSSSSLSSSASSSSTISAPPAQTNGLSQGNPTEPSAWSSRKKPARGIWPTSKVEPIAGLSTARPQSVASSSSGPSAVSTISALHAPMMLPSQHNPPTQNQHNGIPRGQPSESAAILHLMPLNGTFERKTISVPFSPDVVKIGRQTNNKTQPTPLNGYFDSKVLSRQHAEVWAERNGKIWIRDVKSSNGTFVNGQRLSQENRDSEPHELREQDMLELGIDIVSEDQKTIVHHKVAAKVEHAGIYNTNGNNLIDLNFGDLESGGNGSLLGSSFNQAVPLRRNPSQGSMTGNTRYGPNQLNVSGSNANVTGQQRQTFWLQPVTMEQIVKRLNSEMKQARQHAQDLQRTNGFIEKVLNDPKKDARVSPSSHKLSPIKGELKRFSDPPNPPPSQPLPEKPDASRPHSEHLHHPLLKRTDTERPKGGSPSTKSDASLQINSLAEALTTAKREIESQNVRLKDLESLLAQERTARESAEGRALRLEKETNQEVILSRNNEPDAQDIYVESGKASEVKTISEGLKSSPSLETVIADATTSRLQQRLEKMVSDMDEMKLQMEKYRQRAESAEEESAKNRQSLVEMVEKIRSDEAERVNRERNRQRRTSNSSNGMSSKLDGTFENGHAIVPATKEGNIQDASELLRKVGVQNGRPVTPEQAAQLEKAVQALTLKARNHNQDLLTHGGPLASMIGIVVVGFGLMAYLNSWPKPER